VSESETADSNGDGGSPVTFANAEAIDAAVEDQQNRRELRRVEAEQAHEDESAILDAIQDDTVTTRLKGKPMEFKRFLGETENFIEEMAERFGPGGEFDDVDDPEEMPDGIQAELNESRNRIRVILAEHNVDEDKYGYDFWQRVPDEHCFEVITQIREGGEETDRAGN
jgi:hypothetical protein